MISKSGLPGQLLMEFLAPRFSLRGSTGQLTEINDVLSRPLLLNRFGLPSAQIEDIVTLSTDLTLDDVPMPSTAFLVRNTKDQYLLVAAARSSAHYLVTGDNDLLALRDDS